MDDKNEVPSAGVSVSATENGSLHAGGRLRAKERENMKKIIGLMALVAALGAFAISASGANAAEPTASSGATIAPVNTAQMSPLSLTQCSAGTVCAWSTNNFEGTFSWWAASDTGCHSHENNPKLRSGWNRTSHFVWYGTLGVPAGEGWTLNAGANPITGQVCWE